MDFDVLVLGTGLLESILSAEISKKGLTVGHLDNLPFYGRSHSLLDDRLVTNLKQDGKKPAKCNLETAPKLVYANGSLVNLLIDSKVGSYLEFKECNGIYVFLNNSWKTLPESKEDVFANQTLTLIEKRKLMKFITTTKDFTGENENNFNTFAEYLESFDLGDNLVQMILYGIFLFSGTRDDFYSQEYQSGINKAKLYLNSIGRFCKSGFLVGMHGVGSELCQGFCRSSAVHGGTFILDLKINKILKDKSTNQFQVQTADNQVFTCKNLIASSDFSCYYENCSSTFSRTSICRSIHIFSYPLFPNSKTSLFILPPNTTSSKSIIGIQMSSETASVPEDNWVIYLFGEITSQEMEKTIDFLFPLKNHLYSSIYNQIVSKVEKSNDPNIEWCQSCDEKIDDEVIISIANAYLSKFNNKE